MKFTVRARHDGSIGIPVNYRHRLGIQPGVTIEVSTDKTGRISIKPIPAKCSCCGEDQMVVSAVDGMCDACNKLVELYVRDGMTMIQAIRQARKTGRDDKH